MSSLTVAAVPPVSDSAEEGISLVVRSIRKGRGLTQAALSNLLNCSQVTVCRYEDGTSIPPIPRLRVLLNLASEESQVRSILHALETAGAIIIRPSDALHSAELSLRVALSEGTEDKLNA